MAPLIGATFCLNYTYNFLSYDAVIEMSFSFVGEFNRTVFDGIYSVVSAHFYTSAKCHIGASLAYDDRADLRKASISYLYS